MRLHEVLLSEEETKHDDALDSCSVCRSGRKAPSSHWSRGFVVGVVKTYRAVVMPRAQRPVAVAEKQRL